MSIVAVGLNHTTAPLEVRERLAIPAEAHGDSLTRLSVDGGLREVMVLSTCNRVEVYGVRPDPSPERIIEVLATLRGARPRDFDGHYFARADAGAVRHIFRVLDIISIGIWTDMLGLGHY